MRVKVAPDHTLAQGWRGERHPAGVASLESALEEKRRMRCSDCTFWKSKEDSVQAMFQGDPEWKRIHRDGWRECARGASTGGTPVVLETLAVAQDMEDYGAALLTDPNFGCVMFVPK